MASSKDRAGIFVSYSHQDQKWLARMEVHLAPYLHGEKLTLWTDHDIKPGALWAKEIADALDRARVALLLVTPDFLASSYVRDVELPAILGRATTNLAVLWVPILPTAYHQTALAKIQAAHDPSHPIAMLPRPKQEEALVAVARKVSSAAEVNVVANSLTIIDEFEPEAAAYLAGRPEPVAPAAHGMFAQQVSTSVRLVGSSEVITAADLERLDDPAKTLIRSYERTMKTLFERWTELKPKRYAADSVIRDEARKESDQVLTELCSELTGLLGFIESMGKQLDDHYHHIRYLCKSR
jgi:hypothetical protein